MDRRNMLKMGAVTMATIAVGANASEGNTTKETTVQPMNRMDMKPQDPKNLNKHELKHTPLITVGAKDEKGYTTVEITIGQGGVIHPSTPEHWIDFIELYADDKLVGKNVLEAQISRGKTLFAVQLDGVKSLKSRAGCNLHGIWTSEVKL
jgi:superoxide reductase